jgi:hypothetical protein
VERARSKPPHGYATRKDADALRGWHTGEVFGAHSCPSLFAHGVFEADRRVGDALWSQTEARAQRPAGVAVAALRAVPLVVVLDGLETLEERPGEDAARRATASSSRR